MNKEIDTYIYGTREKALNKLNDSIETERAFYKNEYSHINKEEFEIDTNIELANEDTDHIILRATQDGKVEPQNNTIQVADKYYTINK